MGDHLPYGRAEARLSDRAAFVRDNTRLLPMPLVPEISLHVADEAVPLWRKTEEELGAIGVAPPFWAFAWAGGQALARFVLDNPKTVGGKRVLDFAAGSGLVAIAAAKAGAATVAASEVDDLAAAAIVLNAAANAVALEVIRADLIGRDSGWDTVLAADVFYEREMAARVFEWLTSLSARGAIVLIGDPGRSYLPKDELEQIADCRVPVTRELEDSEIKRTGVWRILSDRSTLR